MSFASAGWRHLRDDRRGDQDTNALTPLLVASPVAATVAYAAANVAASNIDLIAPDRKQDATQAPRQGDHRNASPAPRGEPLDPRAQRRHCRGLRQQAHAACTADCAARAGPAFVMCPRWRRSAELSSRGTKPDRGTDLAGVREALDVIDKRAERQRDHRPDARHLCSRCDDRIAARLRAAAARRRRRSPSSACSIIRRNGASVSASAAGSASRASRAGTRSLLPAAAGDSPLAAAARASDAIVPDAHLHQLPAAAQHLPQRPLRRRRRDASRDTSRGDWPRPAPPHRAGPSSPSAAARHTSARNSDRPRSPSWPAASSACATHSLSVPVSSSIRIGPWPANACANRSRVVTTRCSRTTRPSASMIRIWLYRM